MPAKQPLHLTNDAGLLTIFGEPTYLSDGGTYVQAAAKASWLSPVNTLPWFLSSLRPQAFLARQLNVLRPDFQNSPDEWDTEQVLYMAAQHVTDPPGAFSLGSVANAAKSTAPVDLIARQAHYDILTVDIGKTPPASASAGGEQPKFIVEISGDANRAYQHFIVKFSPPRDTPFGTRWRSLLHLERLALDALREQNIAAAACSIVESTTRTYFESQRVDRIGVEGKRHVVAIDALHQEFVGGARQNWIHTCEKLVAKKMLTSDALRTVARIYAFGQYIGNTDMHFGNLSLFIDDVSKPAPALTPAYDMLPMMWRPSIHSGSLDIAPVREPHVVAGYADEYADARAWAIMFWEKAAQLELLDATMREASRKSAARIRALNFA